MNGRIMMLVGIAAAIATSAAAAEKVGPPIRCSSPIGTLADARHADEMASKYNLAAAMPGIAPYQSTAALAEGGRWAEIARQIREYLLRCQ